MGRREKARKLYEKFGQSPHNVSFSDLCTLAEMVGFTFDRQKGSHKIYRHAKQPKIMNFQEVDGKAKPFQVRQLLEFINEHNALNDEVRDV